jgi:exopolysaccharide production protein ExoZ
MTIDRASHPAKHQPVHGLDLVRFAAALMVLFYHLGFKAFAIPSNAIHQQLTIAPYSPPWWAFSFWGWIGVQIFFVISGVVICMSASGATPWRFFSGRVTRLVPTMLVCATVCAFIAVPLFGVSAAEASYLWFKSVTFAPLAPWIAGQIWTLPIEISFYALMWLLIRLGLQRHFIMVAWLLAIWSALYWLLMSWRGGQDPLGPLTLILLLQHGCYFAIGIALYLMQGRRIDWHMCLLILICVATAFFHIRNTAAAEAAGNGLAQYHWTAFMVWALAVTLIGISLVYRQKIAECLHRLSAACRMLGLLTYPLYLLHVHVGGLALILAFHSTGDAPVAIVAGFIASIAASILVVYGFEPPVRRAISDFLDRAVHPQARRLQDIMPPLSKWL